METFKNEGKDENCKMKSLIKDIDNSSLPPLYGMKKNINSSPKRKIITLKLPKVELNPRDTNFMGFHRSTPSEKVENSRLLSISADFTGKTKLKEYHIQTPAKSSMNNYLISQEDIKNFSKIQHKHSNSDVRKKNQGKIKKISKFSNNHWKDLTTSPSPLNEISIKGESKHIKIQFTQSELNENSLYSISKSFKEKVDLKYSELFNEIDLNRNGNFNLDDIINYLILVGINKPEEQETSYIQIRSRAQTIFQVFFSVSLKLKIPKKDFFAVCSVFENYNENEELSLNVEVFERIKKEIAELKEVFNCYSKDGVIDQRELKSILACVRIDDIQMIEGLVFKECINFSRFLRFLPVFLWMHHEVVKQLEINK